LRHVLFCFESAEAMLDKLTAVPQDTLAKIRHVGVRLNMLSLNFHDTDWLFPPAAPFKLLPGLQLDQLTVLGCLNSVRNYEILNGLIKDSNGWKTLRYIAHNSEMLGYSCQFGRGGLNHRIGKPSWKLATEQPRPLR
jgi:hypothetical protein